MSISFFDSRSVHTSPSAHDILNDLATLYTEWKSIVYETPGDTSSNVKELWASDKICITYYGSDPSSAVLRVNHTGGSYIQYPDYMQSNGYYIITTDKGVLLRRIVYPTGTSPMYLAVGKTVGSTGIESHGVICDYEGESTKAVIFTDEMTTTTISNLDNTISLGALEKSVYNTLLIPAYSVTGDEHFKDLLLVFLSKPSDLERVLLSNNKYYIYNSVALPYS